MKKQEGFWLTLLITISFIVVRSLVVSAFSEPADQYLADSVVRIIFGSLALMFLVKCLDGHFIHRTIHGRNVGSAVLAGAPEIVLIGIMIILLFTHTSSADWREFWSVPEKLLFGILIAQQLTSGFFEEMTYRGLLLEGYYQTEKKVIERLLFGLLSFIVFGLLHVIDGGGFERFIITGIFGLSMAAVYLHSGNLMVPMVIHFLHDLFAHICGMFSYEGASLSSLMLGESREIIILSVLAIWSVFFLILPPASANSQVTETADF